jgi:hypothetical protein
MTPACDEVDQMSRFTAKPHAIYLTDNGRALCGEHLGCSAAATGRDISGQSIMEVKPADVAACVRDEKWHPACETCGKKAATESTGMKASEAGPLLVERLKQHGPMTCQQAFDAINAMTGATKPNPCFAPHVVAVLSANRQISISKTAPYMVTAR